MFAFALRYFTRIEDGQDLLEYSLLVSLIALLAFGAVSFLGQHMNQFYWSAIGASL
jgi:Flp pilus assembly pilin Flp